MPFRKNYSSSSVWLLILNFCENTVGDCYPAVCLLRILLKLLQDCGKCKYKVYKLVDSVSPFTHVFIFIMC